MYSDKIKAERISDAETLFREAFERLKANRPQVLKVGSPVTQNNVAREASCDPSALRKSRYPELIESIKAYIRDSTPSPTRELAKRDQSYLQNKYNRLVLERDQLASRLLAAEETILELSIELKRLSCTSSM